MDTRCCLEDLPEAMDNRTIGERELGKSVIVVWNDDDDDILLSYERKKNVVLSLISLITSVGLISKDILSHLIHQGSILALVYLMIH